MSAVKYFFHEEITEKFSDESTNAVSNNVVAMLADDRGEKFFLTAEEEADLLMTIPDKYTPEQEAFLDEMYAEDDDITLVEMNSEMEVVDFKREHGREPNYEEMSQGW